MEFYQILLQLMDEKGWSKYRLSKLLDCSQSTIANWIDGNTDPSPATKRRIASLFDVSIEFLNGETDQRKAPTHEDERTIDELSDVYFSLAKDLQTQQIDPEDVRKFIAIIQKNSNK